MNARDALRSSIDNGGVKYSRHRNVACQAFTAVN